MPRRMSDLDVSLLENLSAKARRPDRVPLSSKQDRNDEKSELQRWRLLNLVFVGITLAKSPNQRGTERRVLATRPAIRQAAKDWNRDELDRGGHVHGPQHHAR